MFQLLNYDIGLIVQLSYLSVGPFALMMQSIQNVSHWLSATEHQMWQLSPALRVSSSKEKFKESGTREKEISLNEILGGQTGCGLQVTWLSQSGEVSKLWHTEPCPLRHSLLKQSHGKLKLEREQRELDPWDATVPEAHQSPSFLFFSSFSPLLGKRVRGEPC